MFDLTPEQKEKLNVWKEKVKKDGIELQKKEVKSKDPFFSVYKMSWGMGFPYTGACGGQFTYMFTPTSLGLITIVKDAVTSQEINLTEYESW